MRKDRENIVKARELRAHATNHERRLWYRLRELKTLGYRFRRQVPFQAYILDFVEHGAKLVVELDGSQHGLAEQRHYDEHRDAVLTSEGYRVLRFWNYQLDEDIDSVVEAILHELRARRPPTRSASRFDLPTRGR